MIHTLCVCMYAQGLYIHAHVQPSLYESLQAPPSLASEPTRLATQKKLRVAKKLLLLQRN